MGKTTHNAEHGNTKHTRKHATAPATPDSAGCAASPGTPNAVGSGAGSASSPAATGITELVFIIDRSGSMGGLESDTVGGYNATLQRHRQLSGACTVSTVLFDHEAEVICDRQPIAEVRDMTAADYQVRGCTALLDALGGSMRHIARVQRYMPQGHKAQKVIFVVITDGMENASTRYTYAQVKQAVEQHRREGWEFLFLGANIDAVAEAGALGIPEDRAATYLADPAGQAMAYEAIAGASCMMRDCSSERIGRSWKHRVEEDTRARGN